MEENIAKLKLYWNENESIVADVVLNVNTENDKFPIPVLNLSNNTWKLLNFLEMKDDDQPRKHAGSDSNKEVFTKTTSKPRAPLQALHDEGNNTILKTKENNVNTSPKQFRERPTIGDENAFSSPTKSYQLGDKQECEYVDESSETLDLQGWFTVENELGQRSSIEHECENVAEDYSEFDDLSSNSENADSYLFPSRSDPFSYLLENGSLTTLSMTSNDMISTSSLNDDTSEASHDKALDLEKDEKHNLLDSDSELHLQETNQVGISKEDEEVSDETSILVHPTESFTLENDCLYYNPQHLKPDETDSGSLRNSQPTKIWLMLKAKVLFDEMDQCYRIPLNFFLPTYRVDLNLIIHSLINLNWNAQVSSGHFDTQLEQSSNASRGTSSFSAQLSASSLSSVVWYTKESVTSVKVLETTISVCLQEDLSSFKHLEYEIQCICASPITENSTFTILAPESYVLKNVFSNCLKFEFEQQQNGEELDILFTKVCHDSDNSSNNTPHALQIQLMDTTDAVTKNQIQPIPIVKHMNQPTKVTFGKLISDYQIFLYDIYGICQTMALGCCEFTYNKDKKYGFTMTQRKHGSKATVQNPFVNTRIKKNCLFPVFKVFDDFEEYLQLVFSCILILDPEDQTDILKLKLPEQARLTWVIEGSHDYLTNVYYSDGICRIANSPMKQSVSLRIGMLVPLEKKKEGMSFRLPAILDYTLNHVVVDMEGLRYQVSAIEVDKRIHLKPLQRLEFKLLRNVSVLFILRDETARKKRTAKRTHTETENEHKVDVSSNFLKETLAICSLVGYLLIFYQVFMKQV
ncbi:uncharacterized protein SOCG_01296 [Schizosaccharomyces octosporus yFS286]|uniref:Uncharacterized protein n=1 Tax=Schizosaccharomyces octosporus (strain yFS286) TaxID=483514 RepID=S9PUC8_SCHOY|nr:uncharacterized protein SOCG_01296 [Schizosaccharomyces octosporus yFS286]EPX71078.1 hypothetical protein SOCG_01296 [Schizosaccharomyces octosporus yFS286]